MRLIAIASVAILCASPVQAQQAKLGFSRLSESPVIADFPGLLASKAGLLGDGSRDHRYAGMYVGLALGGALIALNLIYCGDPDSSCDSGRVITRSPVALVFLGGVGALIGRLFPKHQQGSP